jgi:hypothetical protein
MSEKAPFYIPLALVLISGTGVGLLADEQVDFATQVQPILARNCYACHGPDMQEGSLRFDDRATLLAEADSGFKAIVPGDPMQSELLRRVSAADDSGERMPPEGKPLKAADIDVLRRWIGSGAEYVEHWAFQPIQNSAIPDVDNPQWTSQPIDHFVLSKLELAGLAPVERAGEVELIRRLNIDVTGLPPTPEQVAELQLNWSEATYVRLVDELLAKPSFGERWARMWLDVVRYAESNSFERDRAKPNAWKYRDYVIDAFNNNKPYDQFIREQIAGDELEHVTDESLTATGYYRLGIWDDEPADPLQARFDEYDDLVTTTSQAFLGLTLNCARCHDHKIDPLTQKDYYRMVAFMRDVTSYASRSDLTTNNQLDLDSELGKRYEELSGQLQEVAKSIRHIEQQAIQKMSSTDQRATEGRERNKVLKQKLNDYLDADARSEYQRLQDQVESLNELRQKLPLRETVLGLAKLESHPEETHVLLRGSPHGPGEVVRPAFPDLLGGGSPSLPEVPLDARSAGRRRVLADWLASKDNWMTARVIVNRIWMHYFGRGIVRSPNNFGLMGDPPTHPELVDYLATELMRNDWDLKRIHRTILLSSTYRLSSVPSTALRESDPANHLLGCQNMRRLSAEQIRDAVLAVTGQLNEQRYGPSIYPLLSAEVLASQSRPGDGWGESTAADRARRSIYIHVKRSLPVPLLSVFDFPETDISCEARFLTTQPGQALTMLNSEWMQLQAKALLARLRREVGGDLSAQANRALELVTGRAAEEADRVELIDLVQRLKSDHKLDEDASRQMMCLVALNINSFFYLD